MKKLMADLLLIQNLDHLKRTTADQKAQLQELRLQVPSQVLAHYDRLRQRGKRGVAMIRNGGVCSECHMRVPIGVMATVMHGDDLQLCGSCGRYLAMADEPAPIAVAEPPAAKRKRKTKAAASNAETVTR